MEFTPEQRAAIERRSGDLLLDASAGSGKTSVLVERFVRAVVEDGVDVAAILTITFTEKAAAELRERIRGRLRELGLIEAARATEGAFISTIHGFCARILRTHALAAGLDPDFTVLDQPEAERLADAAFDVALDGLAQDEPGGIDLIAAYGSEPLRGAIIGIYRELRARGELHPALPPLGPAPDLELLREQLAQAARVAGRRAGRGSRSRRARGAGAGSARALHRDRGPRRARGRASWTGCRCPAATARRCRRPACLAYAEALQRFREACEHQRAQATHRLLQHLLISFGTEYSRRKRDCSGLDFEDLELLARDMLARHAELRERFARAVRLRDGRRASGHERRAAGADRIGRRGEHVHGRGRAAIDLRVQAR